MEEDLQLAKAKHENAAISSSPSHHCLRARAPKKAINSGVPLTIIPGYTVLVGGQKILCDAEDDYILEESDSGSISTNERFPKILP